MLTPLKNRTMVIIELMGGLGNQMFQYAFGLRVATERQEPLITSDFLLKNKLLARLRQYTHRPFELAVFGINTPDSSPAMLIRAFLPMSADTRLVRETTDVDSLNAVKAQHVFCRGYWQSERFFEPVAPLVREQFTFRQPLNDFTKNRADLIQKTSDAVFVHIRRGDYVTNPTTNAHHGTCDPAYYDRATAYIRQRIDTPTFFVFSDDLAWVRQELGSLLEPAVYIDGNQGVDSWQDMYLMSQCCHAVIANSSFSWWGAWLIPHSDKIVVGPKKWRNRPVAAAEIGIVPDAWVQC